MSADDFDVPEEMWTMVEPLLPTEPWGHRPWVVSNRQVLRAAVYRMRTGCHWKHLPKAFGSKSTCHRRFQKWVKQGIFQRVFEICLRYYHELRGIRFDWASIDSSSVKAPRGVTDSGPSPTDRGKRGAKRHIMVDERGAPLGIKTTAANVPDNKAAIDVVDAVPMRKGRGTRRPKHLCADKAYDDRKIDRALRDRHIRAHIRRRGEDKKVGRSRRARRWVVERTNSWMNKFRGLLVRWERKGTNYDALVHLGCAMIVVQMASFVT